MIPPDRKGSAFGQNGESKGKDQPHEHRVVSLSTYSSINERVDGPTQGTKDQKNERQVDHGVMSEIAGQDKTRIGAQHDPLAYGKVNDVHHPKTEGESDTNNDDEASNQESINEHL